jgi:hypothetical protein
MIWTVCGPVKLLGICLMLGRLQPIRNTSGVLIWSVVTEVCSLHRICNPKLGREGTGGSCYSVS